MPGWKYEIVQTKKLKWHKTKSNKKKKKSKTIHFFNKKIQKYSLLRSALWKSHNKYSFWRWSIFSKAHYFVWILHYYYKFSEWTLRFLYVRILIKIRSPLAKAVRNAYFISA